VIKLKVAQIGNSLGVVLPKEALSRLKLEKGDELYLTEAPDGYRLTPHQDGVEEELAIAREIMKRRRAVLRALAR
jgi:putative addiction module antidote